MTVSTVLTVLTVLIVLVHVRADVVVHADDRNRYRSEGAIRSGNNCDQCAQNIHQTAENLRNSYYYRGKYR